MTRIAIGLIISGLVLASCGGAPNKPTTPTKPVPSADAYDPGS